MQIQIQCRHKNNKCIIILLLCVSLFSLLAIPAKASIVYHGTCGANLTWTLDDTGLMTISGTGIMNNYNDLSNCPWSSQRLAIKRIVFNSGITGIGERSFYGCFNLMDIIIQDSVTDIGSFAFQHCSNLTSVTIPNTVTNINDNASLYCSNLQTVQYDGTTEQWCNITIGSGNDDLILAAGNSGYDYILKSGSCGESLHWALDSDGLLTIGGDGEMTDYSDYSSLPWTPLQTMIRNVTISNSVTSIGSYAFAGCNKLSGIIIPDSITSIGSYAFNECNSLVSFIFPESVIDIGEGVLLSCDYLTNVYIPSSVVTIGKIAFTGCGYLTTITVSPDNPYYSSLNGVLFNKDRTLLICYPIGIRNESYSIPNTVISIDDYAFFFSELLNSVVIPSSVKSIGIGAFAYCDSLKNVTYLGVEEKWQELKIQEGNECLLSSAITFDSIIIDTGIYGNLNWDLDNNGLLNIYGCGEMLNSNPNEYPTWRKHADSIISINIEPGITSIGEWAFETYANLIIVSIPDSITRINENAFFNCSNLTAVRYSGTLTQAKNIHFSNYNGSLLSANWVCSDTHSKLSDLT